MDTYVTKLENLGGQFQGKHMRFCARQDRNFYFEKNAEKIINKKEVDQKKVDQKKVKEKVEEL